MRLSLALPDQNAGDGKKGGNYSAGADKDTTRKPGEATTMKRILDLQDDIAQMSLRRDNGLCGPSRFEIDRDKRTPEPRRKLSCFAEEIKQGRIGSVCQDKRGWMGRYAARGNERIGA